MTEINFSVHGACAELKINKEVYLRIVLRAFEQTSKDIAELRDANTKGDAAVLQAIAHRLKGDYANLRMKALSEEADKLNILAKGEYDAAKALELIEKFHGVFEEMKIIINGMF